MDEMGGIQFSFVIRRTKMTSLKFGSKAVINEWNSLAYM